MLHLDASLAERALGWTPILDLETAVDWTVAWWTAELAGHDLRTVASSQLEAFERRS
jgi:CDP-glucose 4,6-dehydratase